MAGSTFKDQYFKTIIPGLKKELGVDNVLAIPRIQKIVINMGVGEAVEDIKKLDDAARELGQITGQKPFITRAKKSIAGFKIRKDLPIGCKVTLRGERMYEFLGRLINIVLPRIRDFQGVSAKAFDGQGNYSLGMKEQVVFPEIDSDKVKRAQGMDITIVTSAKTDADARKLLEMFGMPFEKKRNVEQAVPVASGKESA